MPDFPYPTHIEIIRTCAKVLGVKAANKQLDDKAKDKFADYRLINEFIAELQANITKFFGDELGYELHAQFLDFLSEYNSLISSVNADGVTRQEMNTILCQTIFSKHLANVFERVYNKLSGDKPSVSVYFSSKGSCTAFIISWLEEYQQGWNNFLNSLNKENKAKIKSWKKEHTPDIQSLVLMHTWSNDSTIGKNDWHKIRGLLLLARTIDQISKEDTGVYLLDECRVYLWGAEQSKSFENLVKAIQNNFKQRIQSVLPLVYEIQQGLRLTTQKQIGQFEYFTSALEDLEMKLNADEYKHHFEPWILRHKARLHVLNGELELALEFYKKAVKGSLFRAGDSLKKVIEESIVVAASVTKPDHIFLKKLKNAQLTFGYDIPSVQKNEASRSFTDMVESWEIQNWKASFFRVFPEQGMFPESQTNNLSNAAIGPIIVTDIEKIKPDFRYPDRKFKIGDNWQKSWPQLVWFTDIEKYSTIEQLLKKGANVNLQTSSGDTAILIALEIMNVKAMPYRSLDDSFFWLLAQYPHSKETMNAKTDKKRLIPLISAVESGKPEIVRKVLELGADVNVRGATDSQTALNVSLKMVGMLKNPQKFVKDQVNMKQTPELWDSIRRYSAGLTGFTLEHQAGYINSQDSSEEYQRFLRIVMDLMIERVEECLDLNELRKVSTILIDENSDTNAEHVSPLKGYTPLMLAAELDEVTLFNKMLSKGGDPRKTFYNEDMKRNMDCWDIAEQFNSKNVIDALNDIERFFPKKLESEDLN